MDGDFSFEQEQEAAEKNFSACGDGQHHPAADKVYLIEEAGRPGALRVWIPMDGPADGALIARMF